MVPGIPQVYYVGLFAGRNDVDLLRATGVGRDVNRHHYTPDEIAAELDDATGVLRWVHAEHRVELVFDVAARAFTLTATGADAGADTEVRRTVDDLLAAG